MYFSHFRMCGLCGECVDSNYGYLSQTKTVVMIVNSCVIA